MGEMKTAPQELGAERVTFGELLAKYGYDELSLAEALDIKEDTVQNWISGSDIPDATQVMLIETVLKCSLKEVYLAILRTEKS